MKENGSRLIDKRIELEEQKRILLQILDYIHNLCVKNDIKYSLIGGSLIGAVRHHGIIPWDDDIDIILTHDEYVKLIKILKNQESRYKLLSYEFENSLYPFAKLVDTKTVLYEKNTCVIPDYGVYIDIFEYNNFPNNKLLGWFQYKIIMIYKMLIGKCLLKANFGNIFKTFVVWCAKKIGIKELLKKYISITRAFNNVNTDYIISNWTAYGLKKEIQCKSSFDKYEIVKFENIEAMITSDYDTVLKNTFGDYMQLPPENERVSHHKIEAYWKDDYEK